MNGKEMRAQMFIHKRQWYFTTQMKYDNDIFITVMIMCGAIIGFCVSNYFDCTKQIDCIEQ